MAQIPADFCFPPGATAEAAIAAQMALYSSPYYRELLPYFAGLETRFEQGNHKSDENLTPPEYRDVSSRYLKLKNCVLRGKKKISGDVLVVGECSRPAEIDMMKRLINGLSQQKRTIIYLTFSNTTEYREIQTFAKEIGIKDIEFLDFYSRDIIQRVILRTIARNRAVYNWQIIHDLLPEGISIHGNPLDIMIGTATAQTAWEHYRPYIQFNEVFVRNHWNPLSATIAIDAIEEGKTVVTTQHGVISTPEAFTPIIATKILCFGSASENILSKVDQELAFQAKRSPYCQDFIPIGSFFDNISELPSNFDKKTMLVIDQHLPWTEQFYGIKEEFQTLQSTIDDISNSNTGLEKLIVRLHPRNKIPHYWLELVHQYPEFVEISDPVHNSLSDDLKRSSLTFGLFSGALATAAARGIPPMFLWQPGWYYTPDLSCFVRDFFFKPDEILTGIKHFMSNLEAYETLRQKAIDSSFRYYHGRKMCDFDPELIERIFPK
ncbi:hypothetical protein [Methanoculleus sp. 7T]|uniref:hypothetical protein n=1 Tax=Methanoculleus sp. 7T TaxID=2937282 RepID=UPI0020C07007|nr:hypothetical protein [Methanoculleus sp. 7T]MCK8517532.1 hypothetical protein [Methanoculleus sp. 7T]